MADVVDVPPVRIAAAEVASQPGPESARSPRTAGIDVQSGGEGPGAQGPYDDVGRKVEVKAQRIGPGRAGQGAVDP
jgi:hypothetical protein